MKRLLWAALAGTFAMPAQAHNGFGIAPIYTEPFGLIVVDGEAPLTLRWTAREAHADQFYRFRAQLSDFPPTPSPPSSMRSGEIITTLAADQLSYELALDLSGLSTGAWRIYADFDEPPFCVELEQVPSLVVVRKDGDPPPYGVLVTAPLLDSPLVDTSALISVEAIASAAPRVTIDAGEIVRDPDFPDLTLCVEFTWTKLFTVASDLTMTPDPESGPDRFRLDFDWDTTQVPDGAYLFRITTTDAQGIEHITWARRWINVEHAPVDPPVEPGPEPSTESSPEVAEAAEPDDSSGVSDSCQTGALSLWPLLVLGLWRRRRPIVQET